MGNCFHSPSTCTFNMGTSVAVALINLCLSSLFDGPPSRRSVKISPGSFGFKKNALRMAGLVLQAEIVVDTLGFPAPCAGQKRGYRPRDRPRWPVHAGGGARPRNPPGTARQIVPDSGRPDNSRQRRAAPSARRPFAKLAHEARNSAAFSRPQEIRPSRGSGRRSRSASRPSMCLWPLRGRTPGRPSSSMESGRKGIKHQAHQQPHPGHIETSLDTDLPGQPSPHEAVDGASTP